MKCVVLKDFTLLLGCHPPAAFALWRCCCAPQEGFPKHFYPCLRRKRLLDLHHRDLFLQEKSEQKNSCKVQSALEDKGLCILSRISANRNIAANNFCDNFCSLVGNKWLLAFSNKGKESLAVLPSPRIPCDSSNIWAGLWTVEHFAVVPSFWKAERENNFSLKTEIKWFWKSW